jgi:two-component system alkaline phosphatase synthesis response regulator PhoP
MTSKAKILLIDDDPDFVESTKLVLESKPYEVITASNGNEGLAKARKEKPDLIILDIIMPSKDGFNAAEDLKKDLELKKIPVIMLTSFAENVGQTTLSVSQGLTLDTEDYIDKPVAPQELLRRVEKLLKK